MNCTRCEEKYDRERPATYTEFGHQLCDDCRDVLSEAAWESFCEDYYGGSSPCTIHEHYDAAAKVKREQR